MIKTKKYTVKIVISFVLAFLILLLLFYKMDFDETFKILSQTKILFFLFAFMTHYATIPLRAIRWSVMLRTINFKQTLWNLNEIVFISQFINGIVPAKLGEVYRAYLLKKNYKLLISENMGVILMEKVFDITILFMMLITSSLLLFSNTFPGIINNMIITSTAIILFGVVLILLFRMQVFEKIKILPNFIIEFIKNINKGLKLPIRYFIPIGFYTFLIWLLEIVTMYLVILALGESINFWLVVFVTLAASLLTAVPLTPGGLGTVELGIIGIFALTGIEPSLAFSITILYRIVIYWSHIMMGLPVYILSKKT